MTLPIAVLAGGLATRMRPLTENFPKSMLEVNGEPFIAHQLRLFKREGLERVVLLVGFQSEKIVDFVGSGDRFGIQVEYSFEGDTLLGTGGALKKALPLLGAEFLVTYGDSWLDTNYEPIITSFKYLAKPALMCIYRNNGQWDTSNVIFNGKIIKDYSKKSLKKEMYFIDWGLSILQADVIDKFSEEKIWDLSDLYEKLAKDENLAGFEVKERFYEIGSKTGLKELDSYFRGKSVGRDSCYV